MAQLERRKKLSESSPKSPKSQTSPTFEQLLRVDEAYWTSNVSPGARTCHDHEVCPSHCTAADNKKSVLSKVKDTAKKLRHSISGRRKHGLELHDHVDHSHDHNNLSHSHNHSNSQRHSHSHSRDHIHDHSHDHDHITPAWGATFEADYDNEQDYDPEYLGAPMYESEAAPDCLKETARQHPRAEPVVSERHRAPNMNYEARLQGFDKPATPTMATTPTTVMTPTTATTPTTIMTPTRATTPTTNTNTNMITNTTHAVAEKLAPACTAVSDAAKSTTQTVADKLAPACATVSDATHHINANMITNTTHAVVDKLTPACAAVSDATKNTTHAVADKLAPACAAVSDATHNISITNTTHAVADKLAPACAVVSDATHQIASKIAGIAVTSPETQPVQEAKADLMSADAGNLKAPLIVSDNAGNLKRYAASSPQTYDKGVSVKEYFLNKLEPGEDERALSQAITEAISPRKSTGETGVVDKVKEAVTSFFKQEEASNSIEKSAGSISDVPASAEVETVAQLNRVAAIHADKSASPSAAALETSNIPTVVQLKQVASKPASPSSPAPTFSSSPANAQLNRVASVHVRSTKVFTDSNNKSPLIPVSSNAHEVYEEENHGRILQTN